MDKVLNLSKLYTNVYVTEDIRCKICKSVFNLTSCVKCSDIVCSCSTYYGRCDKCRQKKLCSVCNNFKIDVRGCSSCYKNVCDQCTSINNFFTVCIPCESKIRCSTCKDKNWTKNKYISYCNTVGCAKLLCCNRTCKVCNRSKCENCYKKHMVTCELCAEFGIDNEGCGSMNRCHRHTRLKCCVCNEKTTTLKIDVECKYFETCGSKTYTSLCKKHIDFNSIDSEPHLKKLTTITPNFCSLCRTYICRNCIEQKRLVIEKNRTIEPKIKKKIKTCLDCNELLKCIKNFFGDTLKYGIVSSYMR